MSFACVGAEWRKCVTHTNGVSIHGLTAYGWVGMGHLWLCCSHRQRSQNPSPIRSPTTSVHTLAPGGLNLGGRGTRYPLYLLLFPKHLAVICVNSQQAAALRMRALCGGNDLG